MRTKLTCRFVPDAVEKNFKILEMLDVNEVSLFSSSFKCSCFCRDVDFLQDIFTLNLLQLRSKYRGQRALKLAIVRGYNLESLWLCLLQNKVEELNQRVRQAIDGKDLLSETPSFKCSE